MLRRPLVLLLVALTAAVLSGCAVVAPTPSPSSETRTPTATATASPAASGRPAVDRLTLDTRGLLAPGGDSSLLVGAPAPTVAAPLALVSWESCGDGGGDWIPAYPDDPDAGRPFAASTEGRTPEGAIDLIAVGGGIATIDGIRLGSPLDALRAAYGDRLVAAVHGDQSDAYTVTSGGGRLIFEVGREQISDEPAGTVAGMWAVPATTEAFVRAGTDAGSPGCGT